MSYTSEQISFIERATERISENPISRLGAITKSTLERNNFVIDAHCHIFDSDCINVSYLATRMISGAPEALKSWVWRLITGEKMGYEKNILSHLELLENLYKNPDLIPDENVDKFIERIETELNSMEVELKTYDNKSTSVFPKRELIIRYRNIIRLLSTKRMSDVYVTFRDRYAINNVINNAYDTDKELVTIVLGMDLNSGWKGSINKSNSQQNDELGKLPQAYPVIPFLPIDPRRADDEGEGNLYNLFLKAFDVDFPSFFGVKCYPSLGYLPSDSRLKPIFEICEKKRIPVLTHCGGESVSTFQNPIIVNRNGIEESISLRPRAARARYLNEPREWLEVLRTHKDLKLCLGHFGSGGAWEDPEDVRAHRIPTIFKMMEEFNVYADFSFNLESQKATDNFINKLTQKNWEGELMRDRTLFGTDFWVILPMSNLNLDQANFIKKIGGLRDNLTNTNILKYLGIDNILNHSKQIENAST
ncbi:MAG: amidohydrolase family protein [Bacteroidota bacterium]|nr:amidohydrolase family protein [Bacteroidota bacterium]